MDLVKRIYKVTQSFPETERYGLTSQLRRSSTGILANIAESFSRSGKADKAYKYIIARAESAEVHALLEICLELSFISEKDALDLIRLSKNIGRMTHGLARKYSSPCPCP